MASRDNAVTESVIEQSVRARTAAAIELRDQGRHGEAQALFQQNVKEIEAQAAAGAALGPPAISQAAISRHRRRAAAASPSARSEQRKFLRQMDSNPAAPGSRY